MAGTVNQELGLLFQGPNYVIVKKGGKACLLYTSQIVYIHI